MDQQPPDGYVACFDALLRSIEALRREVFDAVQRERSTMYRSSLFAAQMAVWNAGFDVVELVHPDFKPFDYSAMSQQCVSEVLREAGADLLVAGSQDVEAVFARRWMTNAMPTFELTSSAFAMLALTDPSNVAQSDLPWPFPAFRVQLPSDAGIEALSIHGSLRRVVDACIAPNVPAWINALMPDVNHASYREAIRFMQQNPPNSHGNVVLAHTTDGMLVTRMNEWNGRDDVGSYLARGEADETPRRGSTPLEPQDKHALQTCERVMVNLALYLTSHDEATGERVWTPATKTEGGARRWVVGRKVKVDTSVRAAARAFASGQTIDAPAVRSIVRGHFKQQPCGPQRVDRRRIYVAPYWRNPNGTDGGPRTYAVG